MPRREAFSGPTVLDHCMVCAPAPANRDIRALLTNTVVESFEILVPWIPSVACRTIEDTPERVLILPTSTETLLQMPVRLKNGGMLRLRDTERAGRVFVWDAKP